MDWADKKIVVTGAASGIGLELVKGFLSKGCRVVAADKSINNDLLGLDGLYPLQGDLSTPEGVDDLFAYALEKLGSIDVFVANAGFAYYEKLAEADWGHISSIFKNQLSIRRLQRSKNEAAMRQQALSFCRNVKRDGYSSFARLCPI